jgi:demethylmenaquinone methyltransferase/2-methoxy-6-polyprenyl-1,4-benzoquinol methylase
MRIDMEPQDRIRLVRNIFSRVAFRYDLLNHLLSLGRDVFWRNATARRARSFRSKRILDLAAGTGDMAMALSRSWPESHVCAVDFTFPMLAVAKPKLAKENLTNVSLTCGDALSLPFPANTFDTATMAFGIRNIPDKVQALKEILRVLNPGGRLLILELTFPRWSFVRRLYDSYLNRLIPVLGGLVSGQTGAYQYLADSIMDFPSPEEFRDLMTECGYHESGFKKFTFGICILHWGVKPD